MKEQCVFNLLCEPNNVINTFGGNKLGGEKKQKNNQSLFVGQ